MNSLRNLLLRNREPQVSSSITPSSHDMIRNPMSERMHNENEMAILENAYHLRILRLKSEILYFQQKLEDAGSRGFSTEGLKALRELDKRMKEKYRLDTLLLQTSTMRNSLLVSKKRRTH